MPETIAQFFFLASKLNEHDLPTMLLNIIDDFFIKRSSILPPYVSIPYTKVKITPLTLFLAAVSIKSKRILATKSEYALVPNGKKEDTKSAVR